MYLNAIAAHLNSPLDGHEFIGVMYVYACKRARCSAIRSHCTALSPELINNKRKHNKILSNIRNLFFSKFCRTASYYFSHAVQDANRIGIILCNLFLFQPHSNGIIIVIYEATPKESETAFTSVRRFFPHANTRI